MDDIQFLKAHAREESYLFLVDSAGRDKRVWPTPSEYEIEFSSPFKNVYGIDVIDSSVPRTQYIIDVNNNSISFQIDTEEPVQTAVEPGDYTITQLVTALNDLLVRNNKSITVSAVTTPTEMTHRLQFTSAFPFRLLMSQSTIRTAIGFANPLRPAEEAALYSAPTGWRAGDDDTFIAAQQQEQSVSVVAFDGPDLMAGASVNGTTVLAGGTVVRQAFVAPETRYLYNVRSFFKYVGTPTDLQVHWFVYDSTGEEYARGTFNVVSENSQLSAHTLLNRKSLQKNATYYLVVGQPAATDPTNAIAVYHRAVEGSSESDAQVDAGGAGVYASVGAQLCVKVVTGGPLFKVLAPGLYNLIGERYINIRCREIEDHVYRHRAFEKYNVGLAKVQLGIFGYGRDVYDYASFPPRRFHPIGKLKKMTLRFERRDGSLYDFKGIDHNLTMVLRYYTLPEPTIEDVPRLLNPHYNPNLLQYLQNDMNRFDSEDEDQQQA